jgi:phage tail protein X
MDELDRSARSVDKVCRRHYGTTLASQVRLVLGDANDDLLARTHDLIREYWARGIRIGNKYGDLPEIGMTSVALNGRLTWNYGTTLANEVEKILGPQTKPLTLVKVRPVIAKYLGNGIRLHRKYGRIPELDMSSHNLADRLKRNFSVTLTELVDEVAAERSG